MNTSTQHSINSISPPQWDDLLSTQNSQIQSIQSNISDITGKVGLAIKDIKTKRNQFLANEERWQREASQHFELAGYRIELYNRAVPTCPEILINENDTEWAQPQAWSKEINGGIEWFYNHPGALAEAKYRGKDIPTKEQWEKMLASVPGRAKQKAKALYIPIAGCRIGWSHVFVGAGEYAMLWSSSLVNDKKAHYAILWVDDIDAGMSSVWATVAMSLRFISTKK